MGRPNTLSTNDEEGKEFWTPQEDSTRGFYQAANPFLALCAKDHTNQPTVSGPECAKCGTSQPTSWAGQGPARVAHGSKISSLRVFNT